MPALKVGDIGRVTETYLTGDPDEYTVTYEGPVRSVDSETYRIGGTLAYREDVPKIFVTTTAVRIEPRLPNVTGAVVRGLFGPIRLTVERSASGYWYAPGRTDAIDVTSLTDREILHVPPTEES